MRAGKRRELGWVGGKGGSVTVLVGWLVGGGEIWGTWGVGGRKVLI